MSNQIICYGCNQAFKDSRALQSHWRWKHTCMLRAMSSDQEEHMEPHGNNSNNSLAAGNNSNTDISLGDFGLYNLDNYFSDEHDEHAETNKLPDICPRTNCDNDLCLWRNKHSLTGAHELIGTSEIYRPAVDLLEMLRSANCPLYLFEDIFHWAHTCATQYNYNFCRIQSIPRNTMIKQLYTQFDLHGIAPIKAKIHLPGSNTTAFVIKHDFKHCLYSLLNDDLLMQESNLLFNEDNIFECPTTDKDSMLGDINTGSVYRTAYQTYITNPENELLCPIIFFIDKTHTDVNGRLCLEPIRFTLGIFKRKVRNNPNAWRTLGYIIDQAKLKTDLSKKINDYHVMMDEILKSFKRAQQEAIAWMLEYKNQTYQVYFRCPVMFIVGDTDGHDKLIGKYGNRNNTARLCRYCNCPFDSTDDPLFKYKLVSQKKIRKLIERNEETKLNAMSMHCVKNAWHDVLFCDNERGLHGGTLAEIMHCFQHGLFLYVIKSLFAQKRVLQTSVKASDIEVDLNDDLEAEANIGIPLSQVGVFTDSYCVKFDALCRSYGKMLSRQADRDFPRTHFNTNYTSISRKNANEMTGLVLVYLLVFASSEGTELDKQFGAKRCAAFLHLF